MISVDIKSKKLVELETKRYLNDAEKYEKIWKVKYNIKIPKREVNLVDKIVKFVNSENL
tara:strand:+ start:378 stop:554 length:177 start_codon:yes stop_codon:yes gene_type:complete